MKILYQALANLLATNEKVVTVDLYNQNYFNEGKKTLALPAILIDFGTTPWSRNKQGVQQGEMTIRFHIVNELYEDFFEGAETQSRALEIFDFVEEVYLLLQDFSGETFSKLERTQTDTDTNFDSVIIHILTFKTLYTDTTKADNSKYIKIEPDIEPKRVGIDT
jgi:hypothetical protein